MLYHSASKQENITAVVLSHSVLKCDKSIEGTSFGGALAGMSDNSANVGVSEGAGLPAEKASSSASATDAECHRVSKTRMGPCQATAPLFVRTLYSQDLGGGASKQGIQLLQACDWLCMKGCRSCSSKLQLAEDVLRHQR